MEGIAMQIQLEVEKEYQIIPSFVDHKCSSSIFSVQLVENEDIVDIIQQYCNELNNDLIAIDPDKITDRTICMAKYGEDSSYYRGFIEKLDKDLSVATIAFFDYGNTEEVPFQDIAEISKMVRTFVPQAYLCDWKTSTKKGLRKLYEMQCDESEITVKILGTRIDAEKGAVIYTVTIPELETSMEKAEPIHIKQVEQAVLEPEKPEIPVPKAPASTDASNATGQPKVVAAEPAEMKIAPATITPAAPPTTTIAAPATVTPAGSAAPPSITTTATPTVTPAAPVTATPAAPILVPNGETLLNLLSSGGVEKAQTTSPLVPGLQRASNEFRKSVTADCGTMTVESGQTMAAGGASKAIAEVQEAGDGKNGTRVNKSSEEYANMFKNDPEFIDAVCKLCGLFASKMEQAAAN